MRFLHIKGVLAGQHSQREAGILVYLILYNLRKILLVSLIFYFLPITQESKFFMSKLEIMVSQNVSEPGQIIIQQQH